MVYKQGTDVPDHVTHCVAAMHPGSAPRIGTCGGSEIMVALVENI